MGKTYRHPAMKQLKEQQTRFAPGTGGSSRSTGRSSSWARSSAAKRYPYEYLCFRITGFRPDGWPALGPRWRRRPARPAAVRRGPLGDGRPDGRAGDRAGPDGRRGEPAVQRLDPDGHALAAAGTGGTPVRDRRPDEGRVPRVEPAAIRHGPSRAGRARLTVSATDRRGAGRDRPPRPPHGARSSGQVGLVEIARRIARKMARSTETVRTDPEGLRPRPPRPGDLPPSAPAARRGRQGPDLPPLSAWGLGRGPGRASSAAPGRASTA